MSEFNRTYYQKNTPTIKVTLTNADGSPFDLTGYFIKFSAMENYTETSLDVDVIATVAAPATGIGRLIFGLTDLDIEPKDYEYNITVYNGSDFLKTIQKGKMTIDPITHL